MPYQYTCQQCNQPFVLSPSRAHQARHGAPVPFCSMACYSQSRAKRHVDIACATCGTIMRAGRIGMRPEGPAHGDDGALPSMRETISAPSVIVRPPLLLTGLLSCCARESDRPLCDMRHAHGGKAITVGGR
jgi:hypothetical protein